MVQAKYFKCMFSGAMIFNTKYVQSKTFKDISMRRSFWHIASFKHLNSIFKNHEQQLVVVGYTQT